MNVFDCHCDTAMSMLLEHKPLDHNNLQISLDRASKLKGYAQFFGHFTSLAAYPPLPGREQAPYRQYASAPAMLQAMYENLLREVERCKDHAAICRTIEQGEQAIASGKTAIFLSIEGAEAIDCDPGHLDQAYEMGFRMVSPTWNFQNALAGTNTTGGGLTARGKEFVRRAQQLGMLVDVSHISDEAFWDICSITQAPVVASHSNARRICGHSRNLSDDMFQEICKTGGFAGLNLYTEFLGRNLVDFSDVRAHIEHFLDLGGERHIGLGGDLDGCDTLPEGFNGVDDYQKLYDYLIQNGIPTAMADGIFYQNVREVVKQICDT